MAHGLVGLWWRLVEGHCEAPLYCGGLRRGVPGPRSDDFAIAFCGGGQGEPRSPGDFSIDVGVRRGKCGDEVGGDIAQNGLFSKRERRGWYHECVAAYGAHIIPNFSQEHCTALVDPQVIRRFHAEVVTPLNDRHDTEAIFQFFHNVLSAQQLTVNWTIVMPRHRTSHTSEPPEDDLVKVLPRTSYSALPTWIDNLVTKINHVVQLLTNADDLPRSAHGWVFLRALRRYDGPAVPGNQDPQTNQIVHSYPSPSPPAIQPSISPKKS